MDKHKKLEYYKEVIEKLDERIKKNEARLKKAEEIGADNPENKWHDEYIRVKEQWSMNMDYRQSYVETYEKESGKSYSQEISKKIFGAK